MAKIDQSDKNSPISQPVSRDGKTVQAEIYPDDDGGWILEVVDQYGNSTVWDDPFHSAKEAMDEVLKDIDENGIEALISLPPERPASTNLNSPLSAAELDELDDFLADQADEELSMDVSMLQGFLTAIAIGPRMVLPSEWLPWVWDVEEGEAEANFANKDQADRILSLIMRLYNSVIQSFMTDPASFEPIFWRGAQWGAMEWCEGFMLGFQFSDEQWSLLAVGQPTWFSPFLRLGTDDGIDITNTNNDAEMWMNEVEPSLVRMHAYWKSHRDSRPAGLINADFRLGTQKDSAPVVRAGPKVGRNDPCPCGSGLKFKKCCGAISPSPTLH